MKRSILSHERVFNDRDFAEEYVKHHRGMAERVGHDVARKLSGLEARTDRILDVGCGFGATALVLAQAFSDSEIIGIDLSDPLLRVAKQAAEAANMGSRVRFEKADVQQMPIDDNSCDVVINVNMVHLVEDPIRMLNEIERVLAPEGHLFIADLRRSWLGLFEREIRSALTLREARELLGRSTLRDGAFSADLLWWRFEA